LKIVKYVDMLTKYNDVFESISCLSGVHKICINPEVRPVIHAPRRVPLSMMDKMKNELDCMVKSGVIAKVDKPTPWVSSFVCE